MSNASFAEAICISLIITKFPKLLILNSIVACEMVVVPKFRIVMVGVCVPLHSNVVGSCTERMPKSNEKFPGANAPGEVSNDFLRGLFCGSSGLKF